MTRNEICTALAAAGCTTVGFEWNTDQLIERAYHAWLAAGSPRNAVVIVDRDVETGAERTIVEAPQEEAPDLVFDLET